jgi:hypothetical protein
MLAPRLSTAAQQLAAIQFARAFSPPTAHHPSAPDTYGPLDVTLVGLGVVVVIVTMIYSLLCLVRPGEASADHIKRRILEEGREGCR